MKDCPSCGAQNRDAATACRICLYSFVQGAVAPIGAEARRPEPTAAPAAPGMRPEPARPTPPPAPAERSSTPATRDRERRYVLGLGLGFIPLLIIFPILAVALRIPQNCCYTDQDSQRVGLASIALLLMLFFSFVEFFAIIACLIDSKGRFVGLGLLTAFFASLLFECSMLAAAVQGIAF